MDELNPYLQYSRQLRKHRLLLFSPRCYSQCPKIPRGLLCHGQEQPVFLHLGLCQWRELHDPSYLG